MTKAKSPVYKVHFRRRRNGITDYSKRLELIKSGKTRLVVRRSNKFITAQFIDFDPKGDRTLLSFHSGQLKKLFNWPSKRNTLTAYLSGLYIGSAAKKKNIKSAVLDIGRYSSNNGNIVFAVLKGTLDSGIEIPHDEKKLKLDKLDKLPDDISKLFNETKKKILGG